MSQKSDSFSNSDLQRRNWYIEAGTMITEVKLDAGNRKAASARLVSDCPLDPKHFQVVDPNWGDKIVDHICFQYTNPQGNVTFVYVNEANVKINVQAPTWVDRNKQNVI